MTFRALLKFSLRRQASREIAEQQRKAREEAENKRIEQIVTKVGRQLPEGGEGALGHHGGRCGDSPPLPQLFL